MAVSKKTKKIVDETHVLPKKQGGGILKRLVWVDEKTGIVTKYSLVYINNLEYALDNGRVFGYDNDHGYHHKHLKGKITPIEFTSFEDIEKLFEEDFNEYIKGIKK